jgi:Prp18 domain
MANWCDHGWVCPLLSYILNYSHDARSIHERSAREKISADQVAHVLNDEVSRKYIQSLKRYNDSDEPSSVADVPPGC